MARRSYGTGQLYQRRGVWYGRWRTLEGRANRRIGAVRQPGSRDGLTSKQAEAQLRRVIDGEGPLRRPPERAAPTVAELGRRLVDRLEVLERKRSHVETVESHVRVHLGPHFGAEPIDVVDDSQIEQFVRVLRRRGASPKTIRNVLGTLHSIFDLALRSKVVAANPCTLVDLPKVVGGDPEVRYLEQEELEALLRAAPDAGTARGGLDWWRAERVLYLVAAMTGLRQGELLALRWRDLDWASQKVRVRQSYVRGEFGSPKSKRSVRAVPLATRLVGELDELHRSSAFNGDEDLVFANPHTGRPMDRSERV